MKVVPLHEQHWDWDEGDCSVYQFADDGSVMTLARPEDSLPLEARALIAARLSMIPEMTGALISAQLALMSYVYGNCAPDLGRDIADRIDSILDAIWATP